MNDIRRDVRDADIRAAVESRRADDVKIAQKVNAANREAFVQKFPGQLQHSMRLINERLMNCLNKPEGTDLASPATWPAPAADLRDLAQALYHLDQIRQNWE